MLNSSFFVFIFRFPFPFPFGMLDTDSRDKKFQSECECSLVNWRYLSSFIFFLRLSWILPFSWIFFFFIILQNWLCLMFKWNEWNVWPKWFLKQWLTRTGYRHRIHTTIIDWLVLKNQLIQTKILRNHWPFNSVHFSSHIFNLTFSEKFR